MTSEQAIERLVDTVEYMLVEGAKEFRQDGDVQLHLKQPVSCVQDLGKAVVTTMDLRVQRRIERLLLHMGFGSHNFSGEERVFSMDAFNKESPYTWVLDPVDGTLHYASTLNSFDGLVERLGREQFDAYYHPDPDLYSIVLGVKKDGEFLVTGAYFPNTQTLYLGAKDRGVTKNHTPMDSTPPSGKASRRIVVSSQIFRALKDPPLAVQRAQAGAFTLAQMAEHRDFAYVGKDCSPYDVCPASLFVQETGGYVSDEQGNPLTFRNSHTPYMVAGRSAEENLKTVDALKKLGYVF